MAADALLAFAHHDIDGASPHARVGALLIADFMDHVVGLVKGLAKAGSK